MSGKYTPDTIDVKVAYCTSFDSGFAHKAMAHMSAAMTTGHAADFDRWLEKHDREVEAQALEEAANVFEWARDDADYAAFQGWLRDRAIEKRAASRLTATTEEPTT